MYKQFVESYEDADATLNSPSGELVLQFQTMAADLRSSLEDFEIVAAEDEVELERLRSSVLSLASSAKPNQVRRVEYSIFLFVAS